MHLPGTVLLETSFSVIKYVVWFPVSIQETFKASSSRLPECNLKIFFFQIRGISATNLSELKGTEALKVSDNSTLKSWHLLIYDH